MPRARGSRRRASKEAAGRAAAPGAESGPQGEWAPGLLEGLGIVGMRAIEPIVLAALAASSPLLLIGPHGSAKSLLLERLAVALGLDWRHYNASQVNYDDLAGYPVPDDRGGLKFIQTPASVWGAQAVFIDEISRCRPDMQNRLFPIIHERRVQGIRLDRLEHRWAAMNPPPPVDRDDDGGPLYAGVFPLDAALADRFNFIVSLVAWRGMTDRDRLSVVQRRSGAVPDAAAAALRTAVEQARSLMPRISGAYGDGFAEYIVRISGPCAELGLEISGRRANMLHENMVAVFAARLALGAEPAEPEAAAWQTLEHSLPHAAEGRTVDRGRLLVAHREVWKTLGLAPDNPRRAVLLERNSFRRAVLALHHHGVIDCPELSAYVSDALGQAAPGERQALAWHVMHSPGAAKLNTAAAELVSDAYRLVAEQQDVNELVQSAGQRFKAWQAIVNWTANLPEGEDLSRAAANLLAGLFAKREIVTPQDVSCVTQRWLEAHASIRRVLAGADA